MTMTMTTDEERTPTQPIHTNTRAADALLDVLHDTVDAVAQLDPDLLHSSTSAGSAVLALAEAARAATAALGGAPRTTLLEAPGVVVVRDLVAAVSLLEHAASRSGAVPGPGTLQQIVGRAGAAHGRFLATTAAPS